MQNEPSDGLARGRENNRENSARYRSSPSATSTNPIDAVLSRLGYVRESGDGRWMAKCPVHEDGRASLSIRELSNGIVLINDFAGCETEDVLAAIALEMSDLYPADIQSPRRQQYSDDRLSGRECIALLDNELMLLTVAASHVAKGIEMPPEDAERIALASSRIRQVVIDVTR